MTLLARIATRLAPAARDAADPERSAPPGPGPAEPEPALPPLALGSQHTVRIPFEQVLLDRGYVNRLPPSSAPTAPPEHRCGDGPAWMRRSLGGPRGRTWADLLEP